MELETAPVRDCSGNPVPDGTIVTFTETTLPESAALAEDLEELIYCNKYSPDLVHWDALEKHSARESARLLARGMDDRR